MYEDDKPSCYKCNGSKQISGMFNETCSSCGGSGTVGNMADKYLPNGQNADLRCYGCSGMGRYLRYQSVPCPSC